MMVSRGKGKYAPGSYGAGLSDEEIARRVKEQGTWIMNSYPNADTFQQHETKWAWLKGIEHINPAYTLRIHICNYITPQGVISRFMSNWPLVSMIEASKARNAFENLVNSINK